MPAKTGNGAAAEAETKRGGANSQLGINFPPTRAREHLRHAANPDDVLAEIARIRDLQSTIKNGIREGMEKSLANAKAKAKAGGDEFDELEGGAAEAPKVSPAALDKEVRADTTWQKYESQCDELSKQVVRFSTSLPVALGSLCSKIIQDVVEATFAAAIKAGKTSVSVAHVIAGCQGTAVWPFIQNLPDVVNYTPEGEAAINKEWTDYNSAKSAYDKNVKKRKEAEEAGKLNDPETPEALERPEAPRANHPPGTPKHDFYTYVDGAMKRVIKAQVDEHGEESPYGSLRKAKRTRFFISNLIIQLIRRLGECCRQTVFEVKGVRTLSTETFILEVEKMYMMARGLGDRGIDAYVQFMQEKVKIHDDYTAADRNRKLAAKKAAFEAMSDEDRAAFEAKKAKDALAKKVQRIRRMRDQQKKQAEALESLTAEARAAKAELAN